MNTLAQLAVAILETADPAAKATLARDVAAAWRGGEISEVGTATPPARPARPARPELKRATEVPKRKITRGTAGRGALLHALAHIELNAIDLAADIVARFTHEDLPRGFYDDWMQVADEEAKHYLLLAGRLTDLSAQARIKVACDLPSGVETDTGAMLSSIPDHDLTVAFGALKPAHRLVPAMPRMGRVVLADIGIAIVGTKLYVEMDIEAVQGDSLPVG